MLLKGLRPLILALLLLMGAGAQGLWLCAGGDVCMPCAGSDAPDDCAPKPDDCKECCQFVAPSWAKAAFERTISQHGIEQPQALPSENHPKACVERLTMSVQVPVVAQAPVVRIAAAPCGLRAPPVLS